MPQPINPILENHRFGNEANMAERYAEQTGVLLSEEAVRYVDGKVDAGLEYLGERSVKNMIPDEEHFPYTTRIVSDILESNGSSSMATVMAVGDSMLCGMSPPRNEPLSLKVSTMRWL